MKTQVTIDGVDNRNAWVFAAVLQEHLNGGNLLVFISDVIPGVVFRWAVRTPDRKYGIERFVSYFELDCLDSLDLFAERIALEWNEKIQEATKQDESEATP